MEIFKIDGENIKLGQFLKIVVGLPSGASVKFFIDEVDVFVNGELEKRRGKKLFKNDVVNFEDQAFKLE